MNTVEMSASASALPRLEVDPFDPAVLKDPYPFHEHLRELGPVFWVEKYGHYGTARWEPVHRIVSTWQDYTATRGVGMSDIASPDNWRPKGALVEEDPPIHTGIRAPMQRILSPIRIRNWRATLVQTASQLLDETLGGGEVDGVKALAETYVMKALPAMLGVDADRTNLLAIGDHNFNAIGPRNEIFERTLAQVEAVNSWYQAAASSDAMHPGGLGEEFFKAEQEGIFAPGMAFKIVQMLLRGGFDTTISGIGSTLYYFALYPDQYKLVRENPKLAVRAFEEALRLESPAQSLFRTTNEGIELVGVPLEPGVKIQYWLGAGNRDPRKWEEADCFRVQRDTTPSLAFGGGVHKCIGSMVARVEAEAFLEQFIQRVEQVELAGDPVFRLSNSLRTLDVLPLRLKLA